MQTILLIDDDPACRTMLGQWLTEKGWRVFEAEDGEQGIALTHAYHPDAVLCDLRMPRRNGYQFCKAIRSDPALAKQPKIIVTSGSAYESDRLNAKEAGADEYLVKPVRPPELAQLLSVLLESAPAEGPASTAATLLGAPEEQAETATQVRFWGVRGSIATPGPSTVFYGGNTACIEVRAAGEIIILDAGTGIRPLGQQLAAEFGDRPLQVTLLISHTHWDHIQGFPFFVPAYNPKNLVRILGYDGARKGLESTLSNQMESPYFPINMEQMPGNISIQELKELQFNIGPVSVQAAFANHPGVCVGYRLFTPAGSVAYLPDNELFQRLKSQPSAENNSEHASRLRFAQHQDQKLVQFVRGAEVLIIDSQYDAYEYAAHVGWGHSCVDDTVDLAINGQVKRLFLFHHDPNHNDEHIAKMVETARARAAARGGSIEIDAAREGVVLRLG